MRGYMQRPVCMHVVIFALLHGQKDLLSPDVLEGINAGCLVTAGLVRVTGTPFAVVIPTKARKGAHGLARIASRISEVDRDVSVDRQTQPVSQIEGVIDRLGAFLSDGLALQTWLL